MQEFLYAGNVRLLGRVFENETKTRVCFNWSGSGFEFKFKGTMAKAYLYTGLAEDAVPNAEDRAFIGVFIDGVPYQSARFAIDKSEGWYTLAEFLPYGEHTVTVVKQTEVGNGRAAVSKIAVDGEVIEPTDKKALKLEFIGDSITCGYGNICSNASGKFVTGEENFSLTYAAMTAQYLNADIACVAASGNGIYHDYGCNTHNLIPEMYYYTDKMLSGHLGQEPQKWNFTDDNVDAVIIKLGQNDGRFCSGADLPENERTENVLSQRRKDFTEKAELFLKEVRYLRPNTPIIYIYEFGMLLEKELEEAFKFVDNITPLKIYSKREYEGVGANGHWSTSTHARMAMELTAKIKEILCLK